MNEISILLFSALSLYVIERTKINKWAGVKFDMLAFIFFSLVMHGQDVDTIKILAVCGVFIMIVSPFICLAVANRIHPPVPSIPKNEAQFRRMLIDILRKAKNNIENKRGYRAFWNDDGTPKKETDIHICVGDKLGDLCEWRNIDMTREALMGTGRVDFRFSATHFFRACLELKCSSHKRICHGLTHQLTSYMKSEEIRIGFFVIVVLGKEDREKIEKLRDELEPKKTAIEKEHRISIDIFTIDAYKKPSPSKTDRVLGVFTGENMRLS